MCQAPQIAKLDPTIAINGANLCAETGYTQSVTRDIADVSFASSFVRHYINEVAGCRSRNMCQAPQIAKLDPTIAINGANLCARVECAGCLPRLSRYSYSSGLTSGL
jgi:hypothetical protein